MGVVGREVGEGSGCRKRRLWIFWNISYAVGDVVKTWVI